MKFWLLLVVLASVLNFSSGRVYQHKLIRRVSPKMRMLNAGIWADYLKEKDQARLSPEHILGSFPQKVYDFQDLEYIANITIGSNQQEFKVILDTGSANLWVPDRSCVDAQCDGKDKFDQDKSSTYVRDGRQFWMNFGKGQATGFLGVDTVRIEAPSENQLVIPTTIFAQANFISPFYAGDPVDGVLGLAFTSLAIDQVTPPLINAINQGLLDEPIFTVFLMHNKA
ncbi:unnamed protein product, partial [Mesorhabditis belari]|uniref:Peptidase A1 domain-containing protein n=1 Tax=Mesorhabditis belari TaxID=2138241 RepID=A0AAF3FE89_9BILA